MYYNLWFNICAFIVLSELLVLYYLKFNAPFKKYNIFLFLLWCGMISTVTSITNNVLPGIAPVWVIRTSNILYFLAHGLIPPGLLLYVYSLTDYSLRDWKQLIPWLIPSGFGTLLVMTSWFSDLLFWLDPLGGYHRGIMLPILYLITGYNFLCIAYTLSRYKKVIPRRERLSILIFLVMASLAMVFQLFRPDMLVENFICATCLMVSQLTVQNPEIILDGSTGMLNKQGFSSLLSPQLDRQHHFQVGFLVVDNYHELEKNYGFTRLETKMVILADYLKSHPGCTFARMDNRLFCFTPDNFQAGDSWNDLLQELEGKRMLKYLRQEGVGIRFRVKFGTITCPEDADSFGGLMELIDVAAKLPQDKEHDVVHLSTVDVLNLRRRKQIDELVRNAVANNMLHVVFQPIYCHTGQRFCSAEALLRMRTEKLGNISPAEFIHIAEENGSILQMTEFVVDSVCKFIQSARLKELNLRRIHINLSAVDCMQTDLAAKILACLERNQVSTDMISVEITETAFSSMPDSILANLDSLSDAGISVMLDDYGTGYSNLSRLVNVPLDVVKLDKSLVDDIMISEPARIIMEHTIQMMRKLNKKVLAEGVETKEQAEYLFAHGCSYIQGYYFARPMEPAALEALFREQAAKEAAEGIIDCESDTSL